MTQEEEQNWLYEQYNLTHDQVKDNEICLLYTKWNETKMENERLSAEIERLKKENELLNKLLGPMFGPKVDRDQNEIP
jgi:predicted RNase H-like nuclease (RuvC/YqgF family)